MNTRGHGTPISTIASMATIILALILIKAMFAASLPVSLIAVAVLVLVGAVLSLLPF
ncbi:MAG: hypothetical protein ABH829_01470 [archaeon]